VRRALAIWNLLFLAACNEPIVFDAIANEPDANRPTDAGPDATGARDASLDAASDARDASIAREAEHQNEEHEDGESGCSSDVDCHLSSLHCDSPNRTCVACTRDLHCGAPQPRCELAQHACVQCLDGSDCTAGQTCVSNRCTTVCASASVCPPDAPTCDGRGLCIRCAHDGECDTSSAPYCNLALGQCVACLDNSQCPTAQLCHPYRQVCVRCVTSADCVGDRHICNPATGVCIDD
jgi:hypothetical protein